MRLLLFGDYGYGNFSNEAILSITLDWLRELQPGLQVEVASADPAATGAVHGAEAVLATDHVALADAVRRADGVIIGGGKLIHDCHRYNAVDLISNPLKGIPYYLSVAVMAVALNKPVLHFAQSIGQLKDCESAAMSHFFFSLAEKISLCDRESAKRILRLNIQPSKVLTAPDVVWAETVEPRNRNKESFAVDDHGLERKVRVLAVALNFEYHYSSLKKTVSSALSIFCRKFPEYSVLDFRLNDDLYTSEVKIDDEPQDTTPHIRIDSLCKYQHDPSQMRRLLTHCDLLLSSNFHIILTAVQNAIPCVPLICNWEVQSLCRDARLEDITSSAEYLTAEILAEKMENSINKPDAYWMRNQKLSKQFGLKALKHKQMLKRFLEKLERSKQLEGFVRHSPPEPQFDLFKFKLTLSEMQHELQRLQSKETELHRIYESRAWRCIATLRSMKKRYNHFRDKIQRRFKDSL